MSLEERTPLMSKIEELRGGRVLVSFMNFDRASIPPAVPGLATQFHADSKEALFRVLKESVRPDKGIDLFLYTRGGDTNSVWPIVNTIREFDPDFQVLVPFRCHSAGTLVSLGASKIVMGPLSELSPIDPSTGNQFNPPDPLAPDKRLIISVEDVQAFRSFLCNQLEIEDARDDIEHFVSLFDRLTSQVHPLAIGNVYRVLLQIEQLATKLLDLHPITGRDNSEAVKALKSRFFSHLHMIDRKEAREILGSQVEFASDGLAGALDELLRAYENRFQMRRAFVLSGFMKDDSEKPARLVGAVVESREWSYLHETRIRVAQHTKLPPNVQVQLPIGQKLPLLPGLAREFNIEITAQGWVRNREPEGITV